jgi:putative membrane protein
MTNIKRMTLAAVLPVALFLAAPTFAQMGAPNQNPGAPGYGQPGYSQGAPGTPGSMDQTAPTTVNTVSDTDFAKDAAEGGLAEVKLGELAQQKGSSDSVKDFGKRMVEDHTQANDKLKQVASQENMKLPENLNKHDQKVYDRLSQLSGAEFDRAYARDMVRDHKNDIAAFQQEANSGQDSAVKNFASQTLPTLQDHLKMAQQMEKEVASLGGTNTKSSGNQ